MKNSKNGINVNAVNRVDPIRVTNITRIQLFNTNVVQSKTNYKTKVYIYFG